MIVQLGNTAPIEYVPRHFVEDGQVVTRTVAVPLDGPAVYTWSVDDSGDAYGYTVADAGVEMEHAPGASKLIETAADLAHEVLRQVATGDPALTHLPGQECAISIANDWNRHSNQKPAWVWSDNENFAVFLSHYFDAPVGRPDASTEEVN